MVNAEELVFFGSKCISDESWPIWFSFDVDVDENSLVCVCVSYSCAGICMANKGADIGNGIGLTKVKAEEIADTALGAGLALHKVLKFLN